MTKTKYVGKIDENQIISDALDYIGEETDDEVIIHTDDSYDPEKQSQKCNALQTGYFYGIRVKNLIHSLIF